MSKASLETLASLHETVAQTLLDKIKDGTATASDISNAIKFLKDNGIEAIPGPENPVGGLARQFPTFPEEERHGLN